jgi:hypothetical protein
MDNHSKLVRIYLFVCDAYEKELKYCVQRFSNNRLPAFTDQEVMTIMLYNIAFERRLTMSEIHSFTARWLHSWFPLLPSYEAFVMRANRLGEAFRRLLAMLTENYATQAASNNILLVDSMPIITCSGKRSGKVAPEIVDKGYCSTKSIYYHGVKLHIMARRVAGELPIPEGVILTPASESDLNVLRDNWRELPGRVFFADKAYQDSAMQQAMAEHGTELLSPVKYPRGVPLTLKQMSRAADDLFSRAVSAVRQPIESLFAWFLEKTDIQRASKVRSAKGLMVHIFSKLAATFLRKLVFNA